MTSYVVGFAFVRNSHYVVLVKKNKPDWQKGRLNGVGGKIESEDNSAYAAMQREFREETGVNVAEDRWTKFCTLGCKEATIHFFHTYLSFDEENDKLYSPTDETISVVAVKHVSAESCIPNLTWLIPMALNLHKDIGCPHKPDRLNIFEHYAGEIAAVPLSSGDGSGLPLGCIR